MRHADGIQVCRAFQQQLLLARIEAQALTLQPRAALGLRPGGGSHPEQLLRLRLPIEPAHGQFRYEPNVEHVLIQRLFKTLGDSEQRHLQMVLDFLGGAIPYEAIYADMCGDSRDGGNNIIPELLEMAESLLEITGLPIDKVLEIDPLVRYPHLHVQLKKELES